MIIAPKARELCLEDEVVNEDLKTQSSIQIAPNIQGNRKWEIGCENELNLIAEWVTQLPINFFQNAWAINGPLI